MKSINIKFEQETRQANAMQSIEENDEMKVRTSSVICLILTSACQKLEKKKSNNNWQRKSSENIFKSDIKEWKKAVSNSTDIWKKQSHFKSMVESVSPDPTEQGKSVDNC